MVSRSFDASVFDEFDEDGVFTGVRFEKMPRKRDGLMPSRKANSAQSASVRTSASRKAAHELSRRAGGKHRRRRHSWNHDKRTAVALNG